MAETPVADYCNSCGGPHVRNHTLGRLRWAARAARHAEPRSMPARLRLLWHDFVIHGLFDRGGERCQDCGHDTGGWHIDDGVWIAVVGSPSGLLCLPCFVAQWASRCADDGRPDQCDNSSTGGRCDVCGVTQLYPRPIAHIDGTGGFDG